MLIIKRKKKIKINKYINKNRKIKIKTDNSINIYLNK